jgi:tetratricopeptide (TPR) repeat protein
VQLKAARGTAEITRATAFEDSKQQIPVNRFPQSAMLIAMLSLSLCVKNSFSQGLPSPKNLESEERMLLDAVTREPANATLVSALGEYYLHEEKWRESVRWLTKASILSPGNESIGYDLAFASMQSGRLESAKRQIEQMLTRKDGAKLHNLLGVVEDRRGNYVEAAKEYHRAAEIDPSESNIFDLATFLLQHKKYVGSLEDSIKFFRYGSAQFPRSSQMMVGLGVALYAANEYDEAVRVLCAAVDLNPTDRRPIQFLGRARRVSPELAEEVDRRLQDFAERYPGNAATNYFYALSLWERGGGEQGEKLDKIERLLRNASVLAPGWYEPHYQLGVLCEAEKRYSDAIREMQSAVKIDPDFFPAHFQLAVLYNRTGDKSRAAAEAATVKRLKENDNQSDSDHDVTQ